MLSAPLVSIITPSLNQGNFIEQSIFSVLSQDYNWVEYIVMDGGSTDKTVDILSRTQSPYPKVFRWSSHPDGGQAMAVNQGLRAAKGTIIGWLNSDDVFCPHAVSRVVKYFAVHPDHLMVYGEALWIDASGRSLGRYPTRPPKDAYALREGCFLCQPAVFFRSDLVHFIGFLDQNLVTAMDFDYWIRTFQAFPDRVGHMQDCLALSRLHDTCKTVAQRKRVYFESMAVVSRHFSIVPITWIFSYVDEMLSSLQVEAEKFWNRSEFFGFLKWAFRFYGREARKIIKKRLRKDCRLLLNSDHLKIDITNDGWTNKICKIAVRQPTQFNKLCLAILHERPIVKPVKIFAYRDGILVSQYIFQKNGEQLIEIPLGRSISHHDVIRICLVCDSTFVPSEIDPNSTDKRSLGILIRNAKLQ